MARAPERFLYELLQLDEDGVLDLRYELLHRTAAAVLEAQRFTTRYALMLVHSFSSTDASLPAERWPVRAIGPGRRSRAPVSPAQ